MPVRVSFLKDYWAKPNGVHDFHGSRIIKDNKMVVGVFDQAKGLLEPANSSRRDIGRVLKIVAYPRLEHVPVFQRATASLEGYGPWHSFEGSVGSIKLFFSEKINDFDDYAGLAFDSSVRNEIPEVSENYFHLVNAQAHYMIKEKHDPSELSEYERRFFEDSIPLSLAKQYAGWRKRCISAMIILAREHNRDIVVKRKMFTNLKLKEKDPNLRENNPHFEADLRKVCRQLGVRLFESENFMVIRTSKK